MDKPLTFTEAAARLRAAGLRFGAEVAEVLRLNTDRWRTEADESDRRADEERRSITGE